MRLKRYLVPIFAQESYFLVYIALVLVLIVDNNMWLQIYSFLEEYNLWSFNLRLFIAIVELIGYTIPLMILLAWALMRKMPNDYRNFKTACLIIMGILIYIVIGVAAGFNGIAVNAEYIFDIGYGEPFFQILWSNILEANGLAAVAGIIFSFSLALQSVFTLNELFGYPINEGRNNFFEISRKIDKKIIITTSIMLLLMIIVGKFVLSYHWLINLSVALGISNIAAGIMAQRQRQYLQIEKAIKEY